MMLLEQDGSKIYNTEYLKEIVCYKDYTYPEQKAIGRIVAQAEDGKAWLGEYATEARGQEVLQELMNAALEGKQGYKMPKE